jgi:undecaprenyl-diphosphatase
MDEDMMSDLTLLQLQVVDFFNPDAPSALDYFFIFVSFFGDWKVLGGLSFLVLLKDKNLGRRLILLLIVTGALLLPLKTLMWEDRPYLAGENIRGIGEPGSTSSFPSGHATFAFAYATLLGSVYGKGRYFYAFALLIAFSRLYLGQHYPSDILSGAGLRVVSGYSTNYLYSKKEVFPWNR